MVQQLPLEHIVLPDVQSPPSFGSLRQQGAQQDARRQAAAAGQPFASSEGDAGRYGGWGEPWPQLVLGDLVSSFDELSAGRGALGRFTGAQIMPILKQLAGLAAC